MPKNDNNTIVNNYQRERDVTPTVAIAEAIAEIKCVEPENLDITLNDYVDTEALDKLISKRERITLSLKLDNYLVTIERDEIIVQKEQEYLSRQ